MEKAAVPDDTHMVFHGDSQVGASVILQDRDVNPYITIQDGFMYFRLLHLLSFWQVNGFVVRLQVGRHNFGSGFFCCRFDTAVFVALLPIVAGMVEYGDLFGSGGKTLFDDFRDQFRIRVSCQFGYFIPSDIGLYHYFLSGFDELLHTAQLADSTTEHGFRFAAHDGYQVRFITICLIDCLSQYLHRL